VGGDEQNGPKRRQMRRLGSRYVFLFFYVFSYKLINVLRFYLRLEGTKRVKVGGDEQNGPKRRQMRRLGSRYVFLFFYVFSYKLINVLRFYLRLEGTRRAATSKAGPNDARCVVWVLV